MKSLMIKSVGQRDYSKAEAAGFILGTPLVRSSHQFVHILQYFYLFFCDQSLCLKNTGGNLCGGRKVHFEDSEDFATKKPEEQKATAKTLLDFYSLRVKDSEPILGGDYRLH